MFPCQAEADQDQDEPAAPAAKSAGSSLAQQVDKAADDLADLFGKVSLGEKPSQS